mmetsp:Transcript_8656/g.16392  ORF Transcript_8656/g.16392 Transcript_8656/m.16392 type:complete len:369 (+) Transcript_8656:55-1161(+)
MPLLSLPKSSWIVPSPQGLCVHKRRCVYALAALVREEMATLDGVTCDQQICSALDRLQALGPLPKRLLVETKVGILVNRVAKSPLVDDVVQRKAKILVDEWRHACRKRKVCTVDCSTEDPKLQLAQQTTAGACVKGGDSRAMVTDYGAAACTPQQRDQRLIPQRERVRQKLLEALGMCAEYRSVAQQRDAAEGAARAETAQCSGASDGGGTIAEEEEERRLQQLAALATQIEEALYKELSSTQGGVAYLRQARSIIFNLRDPNNAVLRLKLSQGSLPPALFAMMGTEELASETKAAKRAQIRQDALRAVAAKDVQGKLPCEVCQSTLTRRTLGEVRCTQLTFVTCLECSHRWELDGWVGKSMPQSVGA